MRNVIFLTLLLLFSQLGFSQLNSVPVQKTETQKIEDRIKTDFYKKYYHLKPNPTVLIQIIKDSEFEKLSPTTKDDFLHDLSDEYRGFLQNKFPLLNSIFISKLDKFIYHFLLKGLGYNYKHLSDISVSVNSNQKQMSIYRLSIDPIDSQNEKVLARYNFGFNLELIEILSLNQISNSLTKNINWKSNSTEMTAQINFNRRNQKILNIQKNASPDYAKMLSDKVYKGVVLIGSNMTTLTSATAGSYILFYKNQGFEFNTYLQNVNTSDYLKNNMYGTEPMDFLAKEAHSDGDEKNIFRISLVSNVFRAEKVNSDGIKEIIEILVPQINTGSDQLTTRLISNNEFSDWMKIRLERSGTELIYLNGSCWSYTKAMFESAAVNSPLFVNIAAKTVSLTFNSKHQNGTFYVFDGLQKRLSYAAIRKNLMTFADYKNRKKDYYVLPDEDNYIRDFNNSALNQFDFEIKLQRKFKGQFLNYSIETDNFNLF